MIGAPDETDPGDFRSDTGRVVLITGAGKGLGAAFASAWARRGARVIVNNRHGGAGEPSADALARRLRAEGGDAVADRTAVDAPGAAAQIIAAVTAQHGRLDALILNAGIAGPAMKIPAMDEAALHAVMAINFFANAELVRAALPLIAAAPAGRILFVSSTGGLYGVRGRAAYAASKGAVNGYALSLADEQRRAGTGVNILCPYAATAMTAASTDPDPRLTPDAAAAAAVWLTSSACRVTGQIWVAGAGRVRRAMAMESQSLGTDVTPEWLAANAADAGMTGASGFPGGEAAFADFYAAL
ncbi:MAG: SDR family NAD(P)-dependent oxidoreductase [Sandarakinorhabdus sp.]|nr:SDR family NAD(P)-dependent oxidoreductase [Sandarakinorhabdus sp.]